MTFLISLWIFGLDIFCGITFGSIENDNDMKIPDAFNIPILGDCAAEGDSFCTRLVPNSFCSLEKNECFCKVGHVSVQEDGGTICKTLLTNAKCRLDTDCVDVKGSMCHPGAGFCTCPRGTIFVPQRNSCMKRVNWSTKDELCKKCLVLKGICYQEDVDFIANYSSTLKFGCLCPVKNAMPSKLSDDYSNVCNALLMDVGEFCNGQYLICRSQKSICKRNIGSLANVCECPQDHISIYQYHLKYYECVLKLAIDAVGCSKCYSKGGQCYLNGIKSSKHLCDCGRLRNSIKREIRSKVDKNEICGSNLVHISCNFKRLQVCYIPHQNPPYENLPSDLKKGLANVFLTGESRRSEDFINLGNNYLTDSRLIHNLCQLKPMRSSSNYADEYCIDVSLRSNILPCGLVSMKYKNGNMYSGLLQIWTDAKFPTPSMDMKFEINCKAQPNKITNLLGQSLDRTDNLRGKDLLTNSNMEPLQGPHITLKVLNSADHEISSIEEASAIKMDILLVDRNAEFNGIEVEACYVSNVTYRDFDPNLHHEKFIIDRGCSISNFPLFQNLFSDAKTPSTPVHLQSNLFPAFRVSPKAENIYFRCLLKVCRHTAWCKKPTSCNENSNRRSSIYNEGDVKFVVRAIRLQVKSFDDILSLPKLNPQKVNTDYSCQYPMCLTVGHLAMIAISFAIILLLTIFLLALLYRKHFQSCRTIISLPQTSTYKSGPKNPSIHQTLNNIDADDCYKEFLNITPRQFFNENHYEDMVTTTSTISPQWMVIHGKSPIIPIENSYCLDNLYLDVTQSCLLDSFEESNNADIIPQTYISLCNSNSPSIKKHNNSDFNQYSQKNIQGNNFETLRSSVS